MMRLTLKNAIKWTKELWAWLAETGKRKEDWPEWEKYGEMAADCFLCEYANRHGHGCSVCPYDRRFGYCSNEGTYFNLWDNSVTAEDRKKYAALFLKQLEELK